MLTPPPTSTLFPYTTLFRSLTKFPRRQIVIRVIAVQRRHIKSRREARLTLREQVLETLVGILRRAKAREHTHRPGDRKSTRLNSSHVRISYAVFCLKKKKQR